MVLPQVRLDVQRMYLRHLYVPTNGLFSTLGERSLPDAPGTCVYLSLSTPSEDETATPAGICSTLSAAGIRLANKQRRPGDRTPVNTIDIGSVTIKGTATL
jgi:hypothetical protein